MNVRALFLIVFPVLMIAVACGQQATSPSPTVMPTATPTAEPDSVAAPAQIPAAATAPATASTVTSRPSPTPTATPAAVVAPEDQAVEGATLVRVGREPPTLDPHLTVDASSAIYVIEVYGGLVTIEAQNPHDVFNPQLETVGDLAEAWDIGDDGRTYTFHLREEAKFHNGKPVTAQDIKWSLERIGDPGTESPVAGVFLGDVVGFKDKLKGKASDVRGVQVIDDHTLSVTADAPKAYFLSKLTHPAAFVLDRDNVEGDPFWFRDPNGTGPFKLAEYVPGEVLRLERNEFYHLGAPRLEGVRFLLSGGDSLLMYQNDEIHLTGVSLLNLEGMLDPSHPLNQELHQAPPSFDVSYIGMNSAQPPFDDPKVRQAFNYAIDKNTLATALYEGLVVQAKGILPPGFPGYNLAIKGYEYNPEKARQLLRESKYGENMEEFPRITFTLPGSFGAPVGPSMEAIMQMWRVNMGIEMEILQTEWAIFLQDLNQRRFQIFGGLSWLADYPDPENFLDVLFHSESSNNHMRYSNQEVDRLLEKARVEMDQAARFAIYHTVEQVIMEDAPWVPLWHGESGFVLWKSHVKDYFLFPLIIPKLRYVYMTEK
tara:strand:- start:451 stop:2244 length:1794 start_codon:yes stop_codon:yes gene_type:complete